MRRNPVLNELQTVLKVSFHSGGWDEDHALTESARGELQRRDLLILLGNLVGREHSRTVFDTFAKIPELTKVEQKTVWNCLARLTLHVTNEILKERLTSQRAPDMWLSLLRASQLSWWKQVKGYSEEVCGHKCKTHFSWSVMKVAMKWKLFEFHTRPVFS